MFSNQKIIIFSNMNFIKWFEGRKRGTGTFGRWIRWNHKPEQQKRPKRAKRAKTCMSGKTEKTGENVERAHSVAWIRWNHHPGHQYLRIRSKNVLQTRCHKCCSFTLAERLSTSDLTRTTASHALSMFSSIITGSAFCSTLAGISFSSRRRHTRFSGVTGVQTCSLPI